MRLKNIIILCGLLIVCIVIPRQLIQAEEVKKQIKQNKQIGVNVCLVKCLKDKKPTWKKAHDKCVATCNLNKQLIKIDDAEEVKRQKKEAQKAKEAEEKAKKAAEKADAGSSKPAADGKTDPVAASTQGAGSTPAAPAPAASPTPDAGSTPAAPAPAASPTPDAGSTPAAPAPAASPTPDAGSTPAAPAAPPAPAP